LEASPAIAETGLEQWGEVDQAAKSQAYPSSIA
jgi:hypothetical protein